MTTADPTQTCTVAQNSGSNSVVLKPNRVTPNADLPSERGLRQQNGPEINAE